MATADRIMVINPGTQPETIKSFVALERNGFNVLYLTASSYGVESFLDRSISRRLIPLRVKTLLSRRRIQVNDKKIYRFLFVVSAVISLMPPKIRIVLFKVRNRLFNALVSVHLLFDRPAYIFVQDEIPRVMKWCARKARFTLIISNISPWHVEEVIEEEMRQGSEYLRFFGHKKPKNREIRNFLRSCHYAERIQVPSNFVKSGILRSESWLESKIDVLRLGFDYEELGLSNKVISPSRRSPAGRSEGVKVIFVGQINQRKGIGYLLEAYKVAQLPSGSTLTLVGNDSTGMASLIKRKFPEVNIVPFMNKSLLGAFIRDHDIFILPSLFEGFSLAAIEALSTGTPVVVTDRVLDGIGENHVSILTISAHNIKSIREALEELSWNSEYRNKLGINGQQLAKRYTWDIYQQEFLEKFRNWSLIDNENV